MKKRRSFFKKLFSLSLGAGLAGLSIPSIGKTSKEKLFIHHVFFWLKDPESRSSRKKFEAALEELASIESIHMKHIGVPADTDRPVIDNSYHYSLLLGFRNKKDHDIYQEHPIHDQFREKSDMWTKVLVYDSVDI